MPRLVRRAPLTERIMAYLDPGDFLLWLSEELNTSDWEDFEKAYAMPIGILCNIFFMIARANSGTSNSTDVFGDYHSRIGSGWLQWISRFMTYGLAIFSFSNAFYTFYRKRHYRFFEKSIDDQPSTPSARRVRVDSSPMSASPLRVLSNMMASNSAESRAYPDATRDVWEVSVWDPTPLCLRLFCLFSPGHVLIYWSFLPLATLDPHPSVTVATTMFVAALLSVQLYFLHTSFSQQIKDTSLIQKEVMNEYDTKFVHPSLNRPVRDVGIQSPPPRSMHDREVDTYTPTHVINRGFHTNPNPAYAAQYDPDNLLQQPQRPNLGRTSTPALPTPQMNGYTNSKNTQTTPAADFSSPIRQTVAERRNGTGSLHSRPVANPAPRKSDYGASGGDGGSLGVYSHAASPLRKAASSNYLRAGSNNDDDTRERRRREGSPLKRMSVPGQMSGTSSGAGSEGGLNARLRGLRDGGGYGGLGVGRRESGRF